MFKSKKLIHEKSEPYHPALLSEEKKLLGYERKSFKDEKKRPVAAI